MAAPTTAKYAKAAEIYGNGSALNWTTDTIKAYLTTSAYTPDYDNHAFVSSVTNRVGSAVTLSGKSVTKVGSGAISKYALKAGVISFPAATARYMVVFKDTGTEATSPLLTATLLDSEPADVTSAVGIDVTPDATNGVLLVG